MSTPPSGLRADPRERFERLRERYTELPRLQRAGVMYAAALLFGLLVMPFLIWLVGSRVLGPYTHGQNIHAGALALLEDYFLGLVHGSAVFWLVALGPAVLLFVVRLLIALLRGLPGAHADDED